ncbi:unnamed protein product [Oreochromis niloticus]|nr:unnamed protein product [Mustela putorius furo]
MLPMDYSKIKREPTAEAHGHDYSAGDRRFAEHRERVRQTTADMAREAGFASSHRSGGRQRSLGTSAAAESVERDTPTHRGTFHEGLVHHTYAHMPPTIQGELACDHFLQALLPDELRIQTLRDCTGRRRTRMGGGIDPLGESCHATWGTKAEKRAEGLLGMWTAGSPSPRLSPRPPGSGKRHGVCITGTMQDLGAVSRPPVLGGTTQLRAHGGAQRPCGAVDGQVERLVLLGRTWVGSCWYAPLVVNGLCCSALVDTGSSATVLRPDVVGRGDRILPTMVKLQTVTGERAPMLGEALLTLSVGRKSVRCSVWVADLEDCILGLDVLRALNGVIDTRGGTLSFPDGGVVRMLRRPPQPDHPAAHALSERAADSSPDLTGGPAAPKDPLTLTSTAPHAASCPPLLPKEPPDKDGRVSAVRRVWEENCDGLTASEQGLLWQLLLDFKDCFSFSEDDMGRTDLIQHDIDTGDAQPIRMRPRRLPLARQAAAARALREMHRAGLIEPSTSPWASPVVMVPKKVKDEWRFCVDFRPLNKVTKKDPYPLPRIDETLDTVAGSSWFSSLDLRSGYWQVPLAPDARPKTAFITSGGLWQFKVLPFGLCNAPATFERLVDKVLTGIPHGECVVYLDDILVHGASFHAALGALRRVLERVLAAGLKLNSRKCCLMRREVAFLGHRLGARGVGTMDDKIQALKDWPTPRSVQELKSFLGLASYYRRFVRGFSCIAAPLFHLLQKGVTFQWTAGCQHRNADALSRRPCAQDGCHYCERKEAQEEDQLVPDVKCAVTGVEERPSCQRLVSVDATEWRHQQEEDADIKPVLGWIEEQQQPQWEEIPMLSRATKGLWSMFNALRRHDGVLQRGWKEPATGEMRWQLVVPRALQEMVLHAVHGAPGSGHFGVTKTLRRLRQGFYWARHRRDVEDFCRRCDSCTARKGPTAKSHAQLQQFPAGYPMERPEAYSLPDQDAETIVDALVEGMLSRFGVPEVIHTDQGKNFESRVFAAMCEKLGSHKTRTTPLHPQSDGLVERFNRTLAEQLALVTAKHQCDGDSHVPLVLMAYRSAVQDSTSCSPALLMLAREIRTPAEMMMGRPPDADGDQPGPDYARKLQDRMESAHDFARRKLISAGARQKRNYDVHSRGQHFNVGEGSGCTTPRGKRADALS